MTHRIIVTKIEHAHEAWTVGCECYADLGTATDRGMVQLVYARHVERMADSAEADMIRAEETIGGLRTALTDAESEVDKLTRENRRLRSQRNAARRRLQRVNSRSLPTDISAAIENVLRNANHWVDAPHDIAWAAADAVYNVLSARLTAESDD